MPSQIDLLLRELVQPILSSDELRRRRYPLSRTIGLKRDKKLNWAIVNLIRKSYVAYHPTKNKSALAKRYRVSATTIDKILRGKTWRPRQGQNDVAPPLPKTTKLADERELYRLMREAELMAARMKVECVFADIQPHERHFV